MSDCRIIAEDQLGHLAGTLPLQVDVELLRKLFPVLANRFSLDQLAILLASTQLVGMVCPGFHSVFLGVKLSFVELQSGTLQGLTYEVVKWEPRHRLMHIAIQSANSSGILECLSPKPGQAEANISVMEKLVTPGEFSGQRALIVGGSRGIGEVATKLISAGGGAVFITYMMGQQEADQIVGEARVRGRIADASRYDVLQPKRIENPPNGLFTHVYYCASPRIVANSSGQFNATLFDMYMSYYCSGLLKFMCQNRDYLAEKAVIVIPSTVFIEQPDDRFAEYTAAKQLAEEMAKHVFQQVFNLRLVIKRLLRLRTDQIQGFSAADAEDPVPYVMDLVRSAQAVTEN